MGEKMSKPNSMEVWILLKDTVLHWTKNHPEYTIDDLLALWLDPTGSIWKSYKRHKNERDEPIELRIHYLLDLWKSEKASDATIQNLILLVDIHSSEKLATHEERSICSKNILSNNEQELLTVLKRYDIDFLFEK